MGLFKIITLITLGVSLNLKLNPETKEDKVLYPTGELLKPPQKKLDLSKARPKNIKEPRIKKKYNPIEEADRMILKNLNPELFAEEEREEQENNRNNLAIFFSIVVYSGFLLYLKIGADAKRRIIQ
ncbi:unnamed protein product [Caenorhabditis brenneri]